MDNMAFEDSVLSQGSDAQMAVSDAGNESTPSKNNDISK